jgi:MFS family permease
MEVTAEHADGHEVLSERKLFGIIGASSVGTMIEWYDFYIFGSLAAVIASHFYPPGNDTAAILATLATFGAGFAARPFGALVFGRVGDLIGRKYAFLFTLLVMGGATFLIGLLPDYSKIGLAAPLLLVTIRIIQGLALGGEYGGAAVYVAEHAPDKKRGYYTSFIQTTATLGLFISLIVILFFSETMSDSAWKSWGWRLPFLLSAVLVIVSLIIRLRLKESPLYSQLKSEGKTSRQPITDSFGSKQKGMILLMMLWGATAGQAVVWYTPQFYASTWFQNAKIAGVSFVSTNWIIAFALLFGTPFFIVFGWLSDRIGRKPIIMGGCLLGALLIIPMFMIMHYFTPVGGHYNALMLVLCEWVLIILVTMVYGPIAAFLVESFPSRVRYTSVSLPYHIGNGYFGGFLPFIATVLYTNAAALNADKTPKHPNLIDKAPYVGLLFPVIVAAITFVVGMWLLRETKDNKIEDEAVHQRGYSPVVFGVLIALSAIALIAADHYITPTLNTKNFNVQWFFRILALIVALTCVTFALVRRRSAEEGGGVSLQTGD